MSRKKKVENESKKVDTSLVLTSEEKEAMLISATESICNEQKKADSSALVIAKELYTIKIHELAGKGEEFTSFVKEHFGIQETSCRDAVAVWATFSDNDHNALIPEAIPCTFSQLKAMVPLAKKSTPIEAIERCRDKTYAEIAEIRKSEMKPKQTRKKEMEEETKGAFVTYVADLLYAILNDVGKDISEGKRESIIDVSNSSEEFKKLLNGRNYTIKFRTSDNK